MASFIAGFVFAVGLVVADLTNPQTVMDFLDVLGDWNPSLLFVLVSAIITTHLGGKVIAPKKHNIAFAPPEHSSVDMKLICGSAIFGVGWGLAGYCPGPAVAGATLLQTKTWVFIVAMLVGMALVNFIFRCNSRSQSD